MTNDERSLEIVDELIDENEERGGVDMCDFYDKLEAQGETKGQLKLLISLINKGLLTIQQAAKEMNVTVAKFKALTKELATN